MENIDKTLTDVERNKELFEYEMTQVILQLKGEFASLNSSDLNIDPSSFEVKKPELNFESKSVELDARNITVESVGDLRKDGYEISAPSVTIGQIAVPEYKKTEPAETAAIDVKKETFTDGIKTLGQVEAVKPTELDNVSFNVNAPKAISALKEYAANDVKMSEIKLGVPTPEKMSQYEGVAVETTGVESEYAAVPEVHGFTPGQAKIDSLDMNVPTAIKPGSLGEMKADINEISADVPDIKKVESYGGKDIEFTAETIENKTAGLNVPEKIENAPAASANITTETIENKTAGLNVPEKIENAPAASANITTEIIENKTAGLNVPEKIENVPAASANITTETIENKTAGLNVPEKIENAPAASANVTTETIENKTAGLNVPEKIKDVPSVDAAITIEDIKANVDVTLKTKMEQHEPTKVRVSKIEVDSVNVPTINEQQTAAVEFKGVSVAVPSAGDISGFEGKEASFDSVNVDVPKVEHLQHGYSQEENKPVNIDTNAIKVNVDYNTVNKLEFKPIDRTESAAVDIPEIKIPDLSAEINELLKMTV